jgi:hypothetical protein
MVDHPAAGGHWPRVGWTTNICSKVLSPPDFPCEIRAESPGNRHSTLAGQRFARHFVELASAHSTTAERRRCEGKGSPLPLRGDSRLGRGVFKTAGSLKCSPAGATSKGNEIAKANPSEDCATTTEYEGSAPPIPDAPNARCCPCLRQGSAAETPAERHRQRATMSPRKRIASSCLGRSEDRTCGR